MNLYLYSISYEKTCQEENTISGVLKKFYWNILCFMRRWYPNLWGRLSEVRNFLPIFLNNENFKILIFLLVRKC